MQKSVNEIVSQLERKEGRIFAWFERPGRAEGIERYTHILNHADSDSIDAEFKENYRTFYRLRFYSSDKAARRAQETYYFNLLRRKLESGDTDFPDVLDRLQEKSGRLELSFASKLLHTVDKNLPIYDSNVRRVFGWPNVHGRGREEVIARYEALKAMTHCLLLDKRVRKLVRKLRRRFVRLGIPRTNVEKISDTKMLDFALWALGDILKKQTK